MRSEPFVMDCKKWQNKHFKWYDRTLARLMVFSVFCFEMPRNEEDTHPDTASPSGLSWRPSSDELLSGHHQLSTDPIF